MMHTSCFRLLVALTGLTLLLSTTAQAIPQYIIYELDGFGGTGNALAVNASGQVTGWSRNLSDEPRAYIGDSSGIVDLGTLGGSRSAGFGINNSGQSVGWSTIVSGEPHGFIGDASGLIDLGTLDGIAVRRILDINDSGQVIADSYTTTGDTHAFVGDDDEFTDLGTLGGGFSTAHAINNHEQVTGNSSVTSGDRHAFIGDASSGIIDLGTLGGSTSIGNDINDSGQVVGVSNLTGDKAQHAFVGDASGLTDLGSFNGEQGFSTAYGISNSGQVVGNSSISDQTLAFYWESGLGMLSLNDLVVDLSGWLTLEHAWSISDNGNYITGTGAHLIRDGDTVSLVRSAFLLERVADNDEPPPEPKPVPVPEPSLLSLLFLGLLSSISRRRS